MKCGNWGPVTLALDTFCTVSTTTDDVSWAPTSAKFSPNKFKAKNQIVYISIVSKHEQFRRRFAAIKRGVYDKNYSKREKTKNDIVKGQNKYLV